MTSQTTSSSLASPSAAPTFEQTLIAPLGYHVTANHTIELGGVALQELIDTYGTPLYVMDAKTIRTAARSYVHTLKKHYAGEVLVAFACKANLNMGLATLFKEEGVGLDVVSAGELYTAQQVNFPAERIVFNGNNKSVAELRMALQYKVNRIIVDNVDELHRLATVARELQTKVAILVRVAPGIECHTHEYIRTGQNDSKFGVPLAHLSKVIDIIVNEYADCIELKGIHGHIGSQIFELKVYTDLVEMYLNVAYNVRKQYGITFEDLDLGGGLGIAYTHADDPQEIDTLMELMGKHLTTYAQKLDMPLPRLIVEPGRSMVARAGVTLYTVGGRKDVEGAQPFLSVDGGMGDNIRPALYQAEYSAVVANKLGEPLTGDPVRIVGKYCESGDVVLRNFNAPNIQPNDVLLVFGTGAYNYTMSSNYNRIGRPAMVLVENGQHALLLERESLEYLVQNDRVPHWLNA
ncbi:MAG: diaminopimelate decarboxylase [Vampirovibrionales bacterium]